MGYEENGASVSNLKHCSFAVLVPKKDERTKVMITIAISVSISYADREARGDSETTKCVKFLAVFKMTIPFVFKVASLKPNIALFSKFGRRSSSIGIRLQERAYSPNYRPLQPVASKNSVSRTSPK